MIYSESSWLYTVCTLTGAKSRCSTIFSGIKPPRNLMSLSTVLDPIAVCGCLIPQQEKLSFTQAPQCAYEKTLLHTH